MRTLPFYICMSLACVGGAGLYYATQTSGHGTWLQVGSWGLAAACLLLALGGGVLAGMVRTAELTVEQIEQSLRGWLHNLPEIRNSPGSGGRTLAATREEYEALLHRLISQTGERFRLPRWLERLLRSILQGVVVDRFMTSCQQRGLTQVPPQEFRNWLLAEGVGLGFLLLQDQLSWWRYVVIGLLLLLAALPLTLALFTT
ncbi:MAG: hypothetical protein NBKEAIPA_03560 [Nitrospirae bacterium]|nr:MAG: hypothetical protein UZ03_NOB001001656 [Nitrospira sp. OLB3]MBV6471626.1 hypothetical protein [Nitrospirota bacterium]MCK6493867.1 hypothetical protein [Nitrospira sp.]QOJ34702.1 MAG: hypothetical protein HRU82_06990 [Nitrospira sp.]